MILQSEACDTNDPLRAIAITIALRTGLLKCCPVHGTIFDPGQHDYQGACMVATFLVNRSDVLVAPFKGDRVPLTARLKAICTDYGLSCPCCVAKLTPG